MIWIDGQLVSPGRGGVYGERMVQGHRVWDPRRSKFSALCHLGQGIELEPGFRVLYLGAANGTTVSHVADYVEVVYAVESAALPFQDLLCVAEERGNIIPIMADARRPDTYRPLVEKVDLLYQDVAQRDQADILLRNTLFLKPGRTTLLMLKPRSIDVRRPPSKIAGETEIYLKEGGLSPEKAVSLSPYYPDHFALLGRWNTLSDA
jgi:fibrillarin-like pre-rRNA processing protein